MAKTIFLIVPNQVFISDLLRTKYIEYLSQKYRLVVFTPFISEETAVKENYFKSPNVIYEKWDLTNPRFWNLFKTLRVSLVNEFDYLKSIKYWYQRPNYLENRKRRLLRFLGKPLAKILTANFFTRLEYLLLPRAPKFLDYCKRYQPLLMLTSTPGFNPLEAEFIILAKRAGLPTIAVNATFDNMTMNVKHIRKTDYFIAWNRIIKQEAINIHKFREERVFVSGTPRFDPYFTDIDAAPTAVGASLARFFGGREPSREEFLRFKGLNPKYKTIFHTTVTKAYPFQKKYIRDLIKLRGSNQIPYVNLFIRIHPLDIYENYADFFGVPDCCIEKATQSPDREIEMTYADLLNLKYSLKYTDLNINYASTISIEACIFDKPIINIGYLDRFALAYDFDHYRPIVEAHAVRVAKTDEELTRFINMYLKNPALDREGRKKIVVDYVGYTDGLAYQRSVDFLEQCFL